MLSTTRAGFAALSIAMIAMAACTAARSDSRAAAGPSATASVAARDVASATGAPAAPNGATHAPRDGVPRVAAAIATGQERETDFRIGRDLATFVAPDAGVALDVVATRGSADNIHRLHDDPRIDLAIVQYDVVQAFVDAAAAGDAAAARLAKPLRVVTPLYTEEIHFVTRSDSPMKWVHEIRGKRISVGQQGGGSALTVAALYRRMFGTTLPARDVSYLSDDRALAALTVDKTVDVVVVVAAQPARLFADMKPAARSYIKLLAVDPQNAASRRAFNAYFPATIRARSYASWLDADVPALAVMSFLVTSDEHGHAFDARRPAFARSLCENLATLRAEGHPKWREVPLGQQFGLPWAFDAASATAIRQCIDRQALSGGRP